METEKIDLLVLAAQEGKRDAMAHLYRHFFKPMKRYAMLRVNDASVAEDLVQNVWLKVSKRLQLMQDVRVFRSWLYRALRWEIIDWARQGRKLEPLAQESEIAAEPVYSQESTDVVPLLATLNQQEREVMELYYLNELSVNETALVLSIPSGTVKSRLHTARAKLRQTYVNEE